MIIVLLKTDVNQRCHVVWESLSEDRQALHLGSGGYNDGGFLQQSHSCITALD